VGAWDAVARQTITRQCGRYHLVGEADLKGCCDTIEPDWWRRMLGERSEDGTFLRLIRKWRKGGVLETDGQVLPPVPGTPPGGMRSPLLAHVYLHDALDLGCHNVGKPRCGGEACLMCDADDCVGGFQDQADAERFDREVGQRRGQFGLELAGGKTRVLPCTRQPVPGPTSFACRGFELRWGRDRAGKPHRKRRTLRQKRRNSLKRGTDGCQEQCRDRLKDRFRELHAKWRGDDHDDGVHGNSASLQEFFTGVIRILFTWLNRRSQRRRYPWTGFRDLWHHFRVERPHLVGRPPPRLAAGRAEAGWRQRVFLKSPVREHRTPGSVRGRLGNWPSYRDGAYNTWLVEDEWSRGNSIIVQVSVEDIERDLAAYLQRVEAGETVIIVRAGQLVAEMKPVALGTKPLRPFGLCAGEFTVPQDFDAPLPEDILNAFEGV
jgi:antitoxin (DNA-binding transcriptional repressor) of toxin-antitoxin stability system